MEASARRACVTVLAVVVSLSLAGCDWTHPRFGPARTGFNPGESTLGVGNADELTDAWAIDLGGRGVDPVVSGRTVFVAVSGTNGGPGHVFAKDAATGAHRWSLTFPGAGCRPGICVSPGISISAADGKLFVAVVLATTGGSPPTTLRPAR